MPRDGIAHSGPSCLNWQKNKQISKQTTKINKSTAYMEQLDKDCPFYNRISYLIEGKVIQNFFILETVKNTKKVNNHR